MPEAPLVMTDDSSAPGALFSGIRFFLVRRCPMRSTFISQIEANGGSIVIIEKNADIVIADHVRKDGPPGSYSYTFIEKSIANGELENLEDHIAVPVAQEPRPVGSITRPAKTSSRVPFTMEDKAFLRKWVTDSLARGLAYEKGNKMFEQLEKVNPRHTFQSWRDHWIKYESKRDPAVQARSPTPPLEPVVEPQVARPLSSVQKAKQSDEQQFPSTLEKLSAIKQGKSIQTETEAEIKKNISSVRKQSPQISKAKDMSARLGTRSTSTVMDRISEEQHTNQLPPSPSKISRHTDPALIPSPLLKSPTLNIEANSDVSNMISPHKKDLRSPTASSRSPFASKTFRSPRDVLQNLRQSSKLHSPAQQSLRESRRSFTPIQGQRLNYGEEIEIDVQDFSELDIEILKNEAHHIQNIVVGKYKKAWDDFTVLHPRHNALQWRAFYEMQVLPWYEKQEAQKAAAEIEEETSLEDAEKHSDGETEYSPVKDQWKLQNNLYAISESKKDSNSDESQADSSDSSEDSASDRQLGHTPSIDDGIPAPGEDLTGIQSIPNELSPLVIPSKAKGLATGSTHTMRSFPKPGPPSISQVQVPSQEPFNRPQFLDLTNSSSPDQEAALDSETTAVSTPRLSPAVKSEASPQKRKRNSFGDSGVSSSAGPLKTVKVEISTVKMEHLRSLSPKFKNKWAKAIDRRRSGKSISGSGSGRLPTSPDKSTYISLLSDDEEDEVQISVTAARITKPLPPAIPEDEELQDKAPGEGISTGRRESSAESLEVKHNTFAKPYEQELTELAKDDRYGPEFQILAEASLGNGHKVHLLAGDTIDSLKAPEAGPRVSEKTQDAKEKDIPVPNDVRDRASTDEASEQLQFEANAGTRPIFENEPIQDDDKENQHVPAPSHSSPAPMYANAEENLVSPFKAFGSQPKNFHLVTHEGIWAGDIEMQDDPEVVAIGARHSILNDRHHDNLEPQGTEAEMFASAQEQFVNSAGEDEDNVMDEDEHGVAGNSPTRLVATSERPKIDADSRLFLLPSRSPSSVHLHSQELFSDLEDSANEEEERVLAPEPDPSTVDTQTILASGTQEIDLVVPSPHIPRMMDFSTIDTQIILAVDTQESGLDVPFPPQIPDPTAQSVTYRRQIRRSTLNYSPPASEVLPYPEVQSSSKVRNSTHSSSRRRKHDHVRQPQQPSPSPLPRHFQSSPPVIPTSSHTRKYATPTSVRQAPHPTPTSTAFTSTQMPAQPSEADIDTFVAEQSALNYDYDDIRRAMMSTTLDLRLAVEILEVKKRTGRFPKMKGVWTDEDDEIMRSSNAHAMGELEQWHGKSRTNARLALLEVWAGTVGV